ncbi:hypothetical protein GUITHDRAFT_110544 [Guillardia theta CCMP2712]|uniref:Exostosin GT47 domain-containing protein n=1 Tax=Guillardia theta (strain CCMP2712) TaxID=905079 RepID=L1J4J4_GUITC|nr:hypothetical protein GUITHDRAFT_110544 [Guillardia theta CCMP2712]EKX43421.1 hypothetical protein GUITHDRAFT_110544 [Guillardia theta CCMP2712]|eukprot:XP_005830401.1 hypothetical protein GUITHDRAFT_110544 [Guillardia theta CCMP2712]
MHRGAGASWEGTPLSHRCGQVFASAVGDALSKGLAGSDEYLVAADCIFGASLSLNTLGEKGASLASFRLSQRLLKDTALAKDSKHASDSNMQTCRDISSSKSSDPYMSCDTFRSFADLLHDALDGVNCRFHPQDVFEGAVVYVNALLLEDFFVNKHPFIRNRYILVTHCSDAGAPGAFDVYLDDPRIIAWFAQNPDLSHHQKLHPLPIGLANRQYPHGDIEAVSRVRRQYADGQKTVLKGKSFVTLASNLPYEEYLRDLARHRFVLCPAGNGLDTHRTWESLLMGSVPIVASSPMDSLFRFLPEARDRPEGFFDFAPLFADYWSAAFRNGAPEHAMGLSPQS